MAIPVTILSGTLGAGKTTLVNNVLTAEHGHDVAVLVNDMGEVNVDAEFISREFDDQDVVELSNGCICCGMAGELEQAVLELATGHEFEYLLVEPSGISEPKAVSRQFVQGRASPFYDLDTVATVVDARQFYDAFEAGEPRRRGTDSDGRPLSDLIVDGVEFCDTLLLNKTDLVSDAEQKTIEETLRAFQPAARLLSTTYGQVAPADILGTGRFDPYDVEATASWKQALEAHRSGDSHDDDRHGHGDGHHSHADEHHSHDAEHHSHDAEHHSHDCEDDGHHNHAHPPDVYNIDSFVYHQPKPMHPERLAEFLRTNPAELIRAKGWLHVAGRPKHALDLSVAGREAQVTVAGRWIASLPADDQERYRKLRDPNWTEAYGDRETQLVCIGKQLDESTLRRKLDACVLAEDESLDSAANPFPASEGERLRLSPK